MSSDVTTLQLTCVPDQWRCKDLCVNALVRDDMEYLRQLDGGDPGDA